MSGRTLRTATGSACAIPSDGTQGEDDCGGAEDTVITAGDGRRFRPVRAESARREEPVYGPGPLSGKAEPATPQPFLPFPGAETRASAGRVGKGRRLGGVVRQAASAAGPPSFSWRRRTTPAEAEAKGDPEADERGGARKLH